MAKITSSHDRCRKGHVRDLWQQRYTASQIAQVIGGAVTRNAVIGYAARAGLSRRRGSKPEPIDEAELARINAAPGFNLIDLGPDQCRYAIAEPVKGKHRFCGRRTAPGQPFCRAHRAKCYQPRG